MPILNDSSCLNCIILRFPFPGHSPGNGLPPNEIHGFFPCRHMAGCPFRREKAEFFSTANLIAAAHTDHMPQPGLYKQYGVIEQVVSGKYVKLSPVHAEP